MVRSVSGVLNWADVMPRDFNLSDRHLIGVVLSVRVAVVRHSSAPVQSIADRHFRPFKFDAQVPTTVAD